MRTFIAVDVSTGAIARLQNEIMVAGWSPKDIKPVEASNFHFTLIFLGEKSDNDVDSIKAKMAQVQFEPFPLTYTGVGAFPKPANPVGPLGCADQRIAARGRREIVAAAACVRVEIEEGLLLALHRAEERAEQDVFEDVGEVARVKRVAVIHAPAWPCGGTGTFTTTLRTSTGWRPGCKQGMCPSGGKKTAMSPGPTRNHEPNSNGA